MKKTALIAIATTLLFSATVSAEVELTNKDAMQAWENAPKAPTEQKIYSENALTCINPESTETMSHQFTSQAQMLAFIDSMGNLKAFSGYYCETNTLIVSK